MEQFRVDGVKELDNKVKKIGKLPQKVVTKSAKKAMTIAYKAAKKGEWIDQSGEMRKGMLLVGESTKTKGKKVYRVVFDRAKNDIFQKKNKDGKITGYYPASQEHGFTARNGRYIPGYHFMEQGLTENAGEIKLIIIGTMIKEIDKEIEKG